MTGYTLFELKRLLPAILVLQCCGPADPNMVVVKGDIEIVPGKFYFQKFTLDLGGTFTMTLTPQGGDVEAWVEPGEAQPIIVYNPNEPLPKAKLFAAGKEDSVSGTLGWGGAHVVIFNRGPATAKVRCKVTAVANQPKAH